MAFLQSITTKFVLETERKLRKAAEVTRLNDNQSGRGKQVVHCKGHNYILTCLFVVHIVFTLLLKHKKGEVSLSFHDVDSR